MFIYINVKKIASDSHVFFTKSHNDFHQSALMIGISVIRNIVEPNGINVFCSAEPSGIRLVGCGAAIAMLFS